MRGKFFNLGHGADFWGLSNPWLAIGIRVAALVIVVAIVFFIVKKLRKKSRENDEVVQMLKLKFVNGEITEDEYMVKLKTIREK